MTTEQVLAELKKRGVEIDIGACGCCDSPWVKIALDGVLVYDKDNASIGEISETTVRH